MSILVRFPSYGNDVVYKNKHKQEKVSTHIHQVKLLAQSRKYIKPILYFLVHGARNQGDLNENCLQLMY
jgi:hypothetical protein